RVELSVMELKTNATPRNRSANHDFDMNNTITGDNNNLATNGQGLRWSPEGRFVFDVSDKWGHTALVRIDTQTNAVEEITKGDQAVLNFSLTPDARTFVTVISNPVMMPDLFLIIRDGTQRRITDLIKRFGSQLALTF